MAQAPLLAVTAQHDARGWAAVLNNDYSSPATSFVVRITFTRRGMQSQGRHWEDAVPGPDSFPQAIAPGASRTIRMGPPDSSAVSYDVLAVIYADGSTAGEPAFIGHILKARQHELTDLEQALPMLEKAANDPQSTRASVAAEFGPRAQQGLADLTDHILPPADRICQTVLVNMEHPTDPTVPVPAAIAGIARIFARWEAQLVASRPKLAP